MKKILLITAILAAALTFTFSSCTGAKDAEEKRAKYIFLFIGDGMGIPHVAATQSYLSYKAGMIGGKHLTFAEFPYIALTETYTANRNITCSAAGGTAIACGAKTNNEMIGMAPDGSDLKSIAYEMKEDGYKVAIMTNNPVNHATPACFYANSESRYSYYEISRQLADSGFDFFGGSGFYQFKGKDGNLPSVEEYIEEKGYTVCYGPSEFRARDEKSGKTVFIQESGREEEPEYYVSDGEEEGDVKIAEVLEMGLEVLGDEEPFFIMCEGGNIDWAAHSNKTMAMVMEVIDLNAAVDKAMEFYKKHPDETLIVVTADHETGGLSLGQGRVWRPEIFGWDILEKHWYESGEKNVLPDDENQALNESALIGWSSYHHTASPVATYAIGKGAEKFIGYIDNTDIKGKILGE
jgi:alkaline phosphatase